MIAPAPDGSNGFPRAARLLAPRQFQDVFANGKRVHGTLLRLHAWVRATVSPGARLGIAVPKRVAKRAVERNRIRRIVRESFRHCRGQLATGDYVLVAQPAACNAPAPNLRTELAGLWDRASRLKPAPAAATMPGRVGNRPGADRPPPKRSRGSHPAPPMPPGTAKPSD